MKNRWTLLLLLSAAMLPAVAKAQGGCVTSPENDTAVLALIGVGGAISSTRPWNKFRKRSRSR